MSDSENAPEDHTRRSTRCRQSTKKTATQSAIERLRESRESGKAYRPNAEIKDVYELVDEDEYNKIVEERQGADFLVDDDGMGYVDTGVDFEDEYEDYRPERNNEGSSKDDKKSKKNKKEKKKGAMDRFTTTTKPTHRVEEKVKIDPENDPYLQQMLNTINNDDEDSDDDEEDKPVVPQPAPRSRNKFKRERTVSPTHDDVIMPRPIAKKAKNAYMERTNAEKRSFSTSKPKEVIKETQNLQNVHEDVEADFEYGAPDHDDFDEPVRQNTPSPVKKIEKKRESPKKKEEPMEVDIKKDDTEEVDEESTKKFQLGSKQWENDDVCEEEKVEVKTGTEAFYVMGGENNDTNAIKMYWIDAFEDTHKSSGTVYLFGKVKVTDTTWASCCCVVKNIYRQVYFLPRDTHATTGEDIQQVDVYNEITAVMERNLNTIEFKCKAVEKNLMNDKQFEELAGERTNVMEVLYESKFSKLPQDLSGKTFSRIFNTSTTAMERLLIEKKFMGPGWIEIFNFKEATAKVSNCEYEFTVDMERMKNIRYLESDSNTELPLVRLLAINVLTTLNEKKEHEICMISMLYNSRSSFIHPSDQQRNLQRRCLLTKPCGGSIPFDIKQRIQRERLEQFVQDTPNEKALLTKFLAEINKMEPDVIVGHDLSATISVLVSRLEKLKIAKWSRISRLNRSINVGKVGHSKSGQWELTAGRLLLDSKLAAMELVKARSFDLTELALQLLNERRRDIYVNDISSMYMSSDRLINLINWSWNDPYLSLRISCRLNALPLFTQITNIVGGVTSRTMMGGRAERNDYLLLHAFHKADLIAPDKYSSAHKKGAKMDETINEDHSDEKKETGGKSKAQYSGGLVLEPKKGLYDTLILLLDFNSLYPSIIQEYDICFTTVPHTKDSDDLPDAPPVGETTRGVLPKEIRKLVECRRSVKSLMKNEKLTEAEKKQLDIRQLALKLTANSMYGCLGFQYSRFYAKPLAALVTAKGREILMHSKDLVEKLGYTVVYGDTDSIMVNTNSHDLAQAKKLGYEIKKAVNKCHRLLELDLDGVFKRMLLLKKKKYAALTVDPDNAKKIGKELKGLDIVRRDWSQLAKETGTTVVDKILDAELTRDEMVSAIDDLLKDIRERLDSNQIPREKFQISKQLTRNPRDYVDVKSQPHAFVAKRLNESGRFHLRQGDIVEYIICEDGTDNAATQRAYHKTELEENRSLKIDLHYYLAQQIHPVVSRLIEPIEEIDQVRIAEDLGMDATGFRRAAAAVASQRAEEEECLWKQDNYDLCEGIVIKCPVLTCRETTIIRSTFDIETDPSSPRYSLSSCLKCKTSWMSNDYSNVITNQIDKQLAEFVSKHMSAGFECDEPTCEYKIRVQTMKWCREGLECIKCSSGVLRKEYTSKQLFDQQMFFSSIIDIEGEISKMSESQKKTVRTQSDFKGCLAESIDLKNWINEKYLEKNSYNRVDLAYIFAPMLKIQ